MNNQFLTHLFLKKIMSVIFMKRVKTVLIGASSSSSFSSNLINEIQILFIRWQTTLFKHRHNVCVCQIELLQNSMTTLSMRHYFTKSDETLYLCRAAKTRLHVDGGLLPLCALVQLRCSCGDNVRRDERLSSSLNTRCLQRRREEVDKETIVC